MPAEKTASDGRDVSEEEESPPAPVSGWAIALLVVATFGIGMATIVPMAYSLAVRVDQLAPGRSDLLGYVLGAGSAATLVFAPLTGVLSDRTRSRWGRRKPFTVLGVILGLAGLPLMAAAPNVIVLMLGWIVATVGWGTAGGSIGNWQADRLPPQQRGRVSGATGLAMQLAPVLGILMVSAFRDQALMIFLLPAAVGAVFVLLFLLFAPESDNRHRPTSARLTVRSLLSSYAFRPREVPDFAWNWLGRFIFFLGLTLTTSFTVYFFAQRLELPVPEVGGVVALTSLLSLGTASIGALGGGWVSDRLARRKSLILVGVVLFAAGSVVSAFAHGLPMLIAGSLVSSLGIAVFSAVGQAVVLDTLPYRDAEAGRYMAITAFAQKIPGVIAPVAAPLILGLGVVSADQNFAALQLVAAALALIGGIIIATRVRSIR